MADAFPTISSRIQVLTSPCLQLYRAESRRCVPNTTTNTTTPHHFPGPCQSRSRRRARRCRSLLSPRRGPRPHIGKHNQRANDSTRADNRGVRRLPSSLPARARQAPRDDRVAGVLGGQGQLPPRDVALARRGAAQPAHAVDEPEEAGDEPGVRGAARGGGGGGADEGGFGEEGVVVEGVVEGEEGFLGGGEEGGEGGF